MKKLLVIWLLEQYIQEKNNCLFGHLVIRLFEDKNISVNQKLFICLVIWLLEWYFILKVVWLFEEQIYGAFMEH